MAASQLVIRVASLIERPRNLPAAEAEAVYRAGEGLALGLDMALAAHSVKRTQLIAQRANRVAFRESWAAPGGWPHFESALLALEAGQPPPGPPDAVDPELAAVRLLIGQGRRPSRFPQLLGHADAPWYYVPRAFPLPLWIAEPQPQSAPAALVGRTLSVGSVPALATELQTLEPFLRAHGLDPEHWFPAPLLEATAVSLETGLVLIAG